MTSRASAAIMRHEFRLMRTMPGTMVFLIAMPLALAALSQGLFRGSSSGGGGVQLSVPGMAVSFAAFSVGRPGFSFFRDRGWGTWDRLRASPATTVDIVVGKALPSVAVTAIQILGLHLIAVPLFGFQNRGSWLALSLLALAIALCLNAFGVAIAAICRTSQQLDAVSSAGGLVFAALGGALVPLSSLPAWMHVVAPVVPTYWAIRGTHVVVLHHGGVMDVLLPTAVLLVFTLAFGAFAAFRFRSEDSKTSWR